MQPHFDLLHAGNSGGDVCGTNGPRNQPQRSVTCSAVVWVQVLRRKGILVLSEQTHSEGRLAGSSLLDDMFETEVARFFPKGVFADWKRDRRSAHLKFVHEEFEQEKRSFDGTEPIKVLLPWSLRNRMPHEVSNAPQLVALTLKFE